MPGRERQVFARQFGFDARKSAPLAGLSPEKSALGALPERICDPTSVRFSVVACVAASDELRANTCHSRTRPRSDAAQPTHTRAKMARPFATNIVQVTADVKPDKSRDLVGSRSRFVAANGPRRRKRERALTARITRRWRDLCAARTITCAQSVALVTARRIPSNHSEFAAPCGRHMKEH